MIGAHMIVRGSDEVVQVVDFGRGADGKGKYLCLRGQYPPAWFAPEELREVQEGEL